MGRDTVSKSEAKVILEKQVQALLKLKPDKRQDLDLENCLKLADTISLGEEIREKLGLQGDKETISQIQEETGGNVVGKPTTMERLAQEWNEIDGSIENGIWTRLRKSYEIRQIWKLKDETAQKEGKARASFKMTVEKFFDEASRPTILEDVDAWEIVKLANLADKALPRRSRSAFLNLAGEHRRGLKKVEIECDPTEVNDKKKAVNKITRKVAKQIAEGKIRAAEAKGKAAEEIAALLDTDKGKNNSNDSTTDAVDGPDGTPGSIGSEKPINDQADASKKKDNTKSKTTNTNQEPVSNTPAVIHDLKSYGPKEFVELAKESFGAKAGPKHMISVVTIKLHNSHPQARVAALACPAAQTAIAGDIPEGGDLWIRLTKADKEN